MVPFFSYKDAAIYIPSIGSVNTSLLYNTIYQEWYPTRDRTVFNKGLFHGGGAPFFSSTVGVEFMDSEPRLQPPAVLRHLVYWHVALSRRLHFQLPHFYALKEGLQALVRTGFTESQEQTLPRRFIPVEYTPIIRRTFTECFIWVGTGWEDKGVRLVVLGKDMSQRLLAGECDGLQRDLELEEKAKKLEPPNSGVDNEKEWMEGEQEERKIVYVEASMDHVTVWRVSLQNVMRAVLAGEETRKRGLREYNSVLEEWLGEGVLVGK